MGVLADDVVSVARVSFLFDWKDCLCICCVDFSGLRLLSFSLVLTLAMLVRLIALVAFKCDIPLLLFEPGGQFANYGSSFLPSWSGLCHWDIGAPYSEISPQMS